uniref:Dephospho-CoA kinase n=1 Tax=Prevotella sp. GTC17259 TaxID=3236795 RepID=A0AB33J046_9BACT
MKQRLKVAITGSMGSGKSYVCKLLAEQGIQVYDCDEGAKRLMCTSPELQCELQRLVGEEVYKDGVLQKSVLTAFLLKSDANREAINEVVHPAVARDFEASGLDWLESAILFDSGFYRRVHFDRVVCVSAPLEVRIDRIMQRDSLTREQALDWIRRQLPQEEVVGRSDFEIVNDGQADLKQQIKRIIKQL